MLVWGKTYPEFSKKNFETVCTGAIDGETRKLLRIYPISLRYKDESFSTYQWIEADLERNSSDPRPESFKINQDTIVPKEKMPPARTWGARSEYVLHPENVFGSVEALRTAQQFDGTSLALVRPREITNVYVERLPPSAREEWDRKREAALAQRELFVDAETKTKDLVFMPVQYRVKFRCDDASCNGHDMSVRDWGTYALSRKQFALRGADGAERDVIAKIREITDTATKDAHLFLGNTKEHPQSFMIVGFYYPPLATSKPTPVKAPSGPRLPGID